MPDSTLEIVSDESKTLIGMVALNSPSFPEASVIITTFSQRCPDPSAEDNVNEKDDMFTFGLGGNRVAIFLMPAPIPWPDLEGPCATAWWWPDATEKMKAHVAHVIVALMGGAGNAIQRHIHLTHLVAAVAANADAAGVYWGAGTVVHEPQVFQSQSVELSADKIDPQLWIDMRLEQNDDGSYRYFTTGMQSLGHLEIEIDRVTREATEIFEFCYSIIVYLLTSGETIKPGETLGRSAGEKIKVAHSSSMWEREAKVMKLIFSNVHDRDMGHAGQ